MFNIFKLNTKLYDLKSSNDNFVICKDGFLMSKKEGPMLLDYYDVKNDKIYQKEGYKQTTTFYKICFKKPFIKKTKIFKTIV